MGSALDILGHLARQMRSWVQTELSLLRAAP
jgi:hypothetical protein